MLVFQVKKKNQNFIDTLEFVMFFMFVIYKLENMRPYSHLETESFLFKQHDKWLNKLQPQKDKNWEL